MVTRPHPTEPHSLVGTVNADVETGVLIHIAEREARVDDELLGLEACKSVRSIRW